MGTSLQNAPATTSTKADVTATTAGPASAAPTQGNVAAQQDISAQGAPSFEDGTIEQVRDRLVLAQGHLNQVFSDATNDLESRLKATSEALFSGDLDHIVASTFGVAAGEALKALLRSVRSSGGPVVGIMAGTLTSGWSTAAKEFFVANGPKGQLFDHSAFLAAYSRHWKQTMYEAADRSLSDGNEDMVRATAEALCFAAYHPEETSAALRTGMIIPLMQAAQATGAGYDGAAERLNGMYNLRMEYTLDADGGPGAALRLVMPTGIPTSERELLMDLSAIIYELPMQLISHDRRVIADIAPNQPAKVAFVDPTAKAALQSYGSGLSESALSALRLKSREDPDRAVRDAALAELAGYEDEAVDRTWADIMSAVGARTIRDLEADGLDVVGLG